MGAQISSPPGADRSAAYLRKDSIEDVRTIFNELKRAQDENSSNLPDPLPSASSLSPSHAINRRTFGTYFNYPKHIRDAIFDEFDADNNGTLDADEFMRGMALCSSGSLDSKIRFCFKSFDASGDGFLQREELKEILLSTTFSSFALLEAVGRSMDRASQKSRAADRAEPRPDRPMDRLTKKAKFKGEVEWMVRQAYANSDPNNDGKMDYQEFFSWVSNNKPVMEVLYGLFQLKVEAGNLETEGTGVGRKERQSGGLFRRTGRVTPELEVMSALEENDSMEWGGGMDGYNKFGETRNSRMETKTLSIADQSKKKRSPARKRGGVSLTSSPGLQRSESAAVLVKSQSKAGNLRKRWRHWGQVTFFISMFGLLCMVVERLVLHHAYNDEPNTFSHTLRYVVSVDCFLLILSYIVWTRAHVAMLREQGHVNPVATICSTVYIRRKLMWEIFIGLIHVPPHAMEALTPHAPGAAYWLTNVLSWSMLLRLHVLPAMVQQHFLEANVTLKQEFLAKLSQVKFSVMFTLRAELSIAPFRLVLATLCLAMIVSTFLLEEAELGLDCLSVPIWTNASNTSDRTRNYMSVNATSYLTHETVHSGGAGGAGTADSWNWIYEGRCHSSPTISGTGWLYFAMNVALAVDPLRVPMSPSGDAFGVLTGAASLVLFAITVSAIQDMLSPSREEMRVIQVIGEERIRVLTRRAAISLIQRSWRIYAKTKRQARKIGGADFDDSFGPHWDGLGEDARAFKKKLAASRKQISLSLWRWKQMKRQLHSNTPMMDGISIDVSHVVNELVQQDGDCRATAERIIRLEESAEKGVAMLVERVKMIVQHLKAK